MRGFVFLLLLAACGDDDVTSDPVDAAPPADAAFPDAGTCDPEAQRGCVDAEKCTFVAAGDTFELACRPVGLVGANGSCTRDPVLGHGHDDCAAGGFCTFIGVLPPDHGGQRFCRRICSDDGACEEGQRCAVVGAGFGMCGPRCAPFAACTDGMTCGELWPAQTGGYFLVCRPHTDAVPGATCTADADCGAEQICFLDGTCRALCDEAHACSTGTCSVLLDDAGVCTLYLESSAPRRPAAARVNLGADR